MYYSETTFPATTTYSAGSTFPATTTYSAVPYFGAPTATYSAFPSTTTLPTTTLNAFPSTTTLPMTYATPTYTTPLTTSTPLSSTALPSTTYYSTPISSFGAPLMGTVSPAIPSVLPTTTLALGSTYFPSTISSFPTFGSPFGTPFGVFPGVLPTMPAQPEPEHAQAFREKMKAEGLSDSFINAFLAVYKDLVEGKTGMMPEDTIKPVETLPTLDSLTDEVDPSLLSETVVLKLNGGLGTGMGLDKAKSLLVVKGEDTFLDFTAKQILHLREALQAPDLKFMLMNSFSTSDDTKAFFAKYPEFASDPDLELLQNKAPKVDAETLKPATCEANPSLEWCPPGHGDLYAALAGSGKMDAMLAAGIKYIFVSNSDNLGAALDPKILAFFAKSGTPMCMEVCERTESDKKGGHLAMDQDGKLVLRESAQCPKEDEDKFQDISVHKFFNTNNLWLNLPLLKKAMDENNGVLPLPLIRNSKTVDPRDSNSGKVYQLETAMGAAIAALPGSIALCVPRTRFAPVKTCNDLLALRSDAYVVSEDFRLRLNPAMAAPPVIDMDSKLYKMVDQLEMAIPNGVPSLVGCKKLKVKGPIEFEAGTVIEGEVTIENSEEERKTVSGLISG